MAYNRIEQLKRTLPSIRFHRVDEAILVDDGSEDGTSDWIAQEYPDIKVIRSEKSAEDKWLNPAKARNIGVTAAIGDIVIVQDAECHHISDALAQAIAHLQCRRPLLVTPEAPIYEQYGIRPHGPNPAYRYLFMATWKEDWIAIGGCNEFYTQWGNEDVELETRWLTAGYDIIADPKIELRHLAHHSTEGDQQRWRFECEFHQWYSDRLKEGLGDPRLIWQH